MNKEASLSLTKAKVGIILNNPFFACLMMQKQFVEDASVKTCMTNGKILKYNPEFFLSLKNEELQGVICHEIMHTALLHHTRRNGRDIGDWNKACDYALNPILKEGKITLPKDAMIDPKFKDQSAEAIYRVLQEGKEKSDNNGNNPDNNGGNDGNGQAQPDFGMGGVEDAPAQTQSELDQIEAEAKQEVAQAMQIAKMQGSIPGSLQRLVEAAMQPKVDWKEELARFITDICRNDYSFSRPNRRYLHTGFILPSLYNIEIGSIVLIVDTSASMDEELLNLVAAEMHDIAAVFNTIIEVIYVDTKVAGSQTIEPNDVFKLEPKGGGGTDFRPAFPYMEENSINPAVTVYFTDGECNRFPETEPDAPLLWAIYDNDSFKPPFGEVLYVDKN